MVNMFKMDSGANIFAVTYWDVLWIAGAQLFNGKVITVLQNVKDTLVNRINTWHDYALRFGISCYFVIFIVSAEFFNFEELLFGLKGWDGKLIKFYVGVMFLYYTKKTLPNTKAIFGTNSDEVLTKFKEQQQAIADNQVNNPNPETELSEVKKDDNVTRPKEDSRQDQRGVIGKFKDSAEEMTSFLGRSKRGIQM